MPYHVHINANQSLPFIRTLKNPSVLLPCFFLPLFSLTILLVASQQLPLRHLLFLLSGPFHSVRVSPPSRDSTILALLPHSDLLPYNPLLAGGLDEVAWVAVFAQGVGDMGAGVDVLVVVAHFLSLQDRGV